ncbi:hypothetical protein [Abyssibius alkaniclasticus]|uniref:hypothetical protein n=1 Tax=Abyssibius alkaniclasticus TaxID=2881234 RepID=UPI004058307F
MARLLAFIIFIAALAAGGMDAFFAFDKRTDFEFLSIGDHWFRLDPDSLFGMQAAMEKMGLWSAMDYVFQFLMMPAAPTLAVIAVVLWVLGGLFRRNRVATPRPGKVKGAKNSTRARRNAAALHDNKHDTVQASRSGPVRRMR